MFRCSCLVIVLSLCVFGQADVLMSTPSKSFPFPTDQPILEETLAPTIPPTTKGSADDVTEYVLNDSTFQPAPGRSDSTPVVPTDTVASISAQPTNATTEAPSPQPTNATTEAPSPQPTNATTASPPTPTTPPLPKVGDYVVRASPDSSACLLSRMGLQFSYRMGDSFQTINLDPNVTKTTGTCGDASNESALALISDKIVVQFVFSNQTSKFFLSALNFTVVTESGPNFTAVNTNLSLWEASLGSSYMCKKEQSFNITDFLILNTFELQVQPFGVTNDQFSTAHECSVDDTSLLIPIIVGAALGVLILIVVIAYVIGRRKTYVGYQTL